MHINVWKTVKAINIKEMTAYYMKNILIRFLIFIRERVSAPSMTCHHPPKGPAAPVIAPLHNRIFTSGLRQQILFFLCCGMLFLAGCAPGALLIREADLASMDQRLSDQAQRTAHILELQTMNHEILARLAEKAEENKGCEPMIPLLEKILDNQAINLCLLEEIPGKFSMKIQSEARSAPPPSLPPRTLESMGSQKIIVGVVEKVRISPPGLVFPALMDTGAEVSSLDARNIQRFERDGKRWVRFDVLHPETGEMVPMEQRLERKTRILQSISDEFERRLVVELSFSFGDITQIAEFTLADRSHLSYPVLIGRNILKDVMVVDVSRSNATPVKSKNPSEKKAKKKDAN